MIIDSHSHLHDPKFASDLDEVLARAKDAGLTDLVTIGCDIETTKRAQAVAHKYPQVFFSAGFHPHEAKFLNDETFAELTEMAKDKKCVAIGECGLDYYYEHSPKEAQLEAFKRQLELAEYLNKPVVIHLRDAYEDCLNMLRDKTWPGRKVVIHCFSGTVSHAQAFVDIGCHISFSGIITFKKPLDLLEVAKMVPANRIIIETDCPYLAPHPFRGQRNEPAYIVNTLNVVAQARGEDVDSLAKTIHQNTLGFFALRG
jgi:TatD DNase family protein